MHTIYFKNQKMNPNKSYAGSKRIVYKTFHIIIESISYLPI